MSKMSEILALQASLNCNAPGRLSFGESRVHLGRLGIRLMKTEFAEYRVNFIHGTESTAAYESSLSAAIETGLAMLAERVRTSGRAMVPGATSIALYALANRSH